MTERIVRAQNVSQNCMVCGVENAAGLHARFFELEGGELLGVFTPAQHHQGYPGRLHGGIATTMLDEAIGRTVSIADPDAWGVTVELNVRFKKPVPLGEELHVRARMTRDGRLFEGSGEIVLADETVAVEATGKYLRMSVERIVEGDFLEQWIPDERPLPGSIAP